MPRVLPNNRIAPTGLFSIWEGARFICASDVPASRPNGQEWRHKNSDIEWELLTPSPKGRTALAHSDAGFTLWFTGLSGAGKSTLSERVAIELRQRGKQVEILDGDEVRTYLSKGLGFSKEDRDTNILRIGFVSKLLSRHGVVAITAAISPYRETREAVRSQVDHFVEVYVKCPIEECIRRDVKGLYKKALAGEILQFTGISDPYEEPLNPEIVVETDKQSEESCAALILERLEEMGYLQSSADAPSQPSVISRSS